eukprot:TRINITY_DN65535_c0_g1_i1.p1 TRINITY_DN65535_c0_g1~~TRINITY_DN65535_c0_g1_i1.p1  ORF type:complete len:401 (+),score=37.69 TRINITY_DN65535_c0_g1_i1:128-1330(+)
MGPCLAREVRPKGATLSISVSSRTLPTWSSILGSFDRVYAAASWLFTPSGDRFFSMGYGEIGKVRTLRESLLKEWAKDGMQKWWKAAPQTTVHWEKSASAIVSEHPRLERPLHDNAGEAVTKASRIYDGTFLSPVADYLPEEVRTCHIRFVVPDGPVRGVVVHTAATNTEDYVSRQKLAEPLVEHGIASIIMIVPYYGVRRAHGQTSSKLLTVADYQLQNLAVVYEGVAILRWLHAKYPWAPLGVTGISWGGAMAACIGVASRMSVACVPCLGSTSPAVMVTGIINWQLDWRKLMDEQAHTLEQSKSALEAEFRGITLQTLVDTAPSPKVTIPSMVQVSALDDYFVEAWEGQELYDALSRACKRHSLRWVDGGHVASFVRADADFITAIVKAFDDMAHQT